MINSKLFRDYTTSATVGGSHEQFWLAANKMATLREEERLATRGQGVPNERTAFDLLCARGEMKANGGSGIEGIPIGFTQALPSKTITKACKHFNQIRYNIDEEDSQPWGWKHHEAIGTPKEARAKQLEKHRWLNGQQRV